MQMVMLKPAVLKNEEEALDDLCLIRFFIRNRKD